VDVPVVVEPVVEVVVPEVVVEVDAVVEVDVPDVDVVVERVDEVVVVVAVAVVNFGRPGAFFFSASAVPFSECAALSSGLLSFSCCTSVALPVGVP